MALILVGYLVWFIFLRTIIKLFKRCCAKAVKMTEGVTKVEQDVFTCVNYHQLKLELNSTKAEIRTARIMNETGNHN